MNLSKSIKEYSTYIFCYLTEEHFFVVVFVKENDIAKIYSMHYRGSQNTEQDVVSEASRKCLLN